MSRRSGTVTIRDVAAAAGVSISTVSRVLDHRLPRSSSPAAEKVRTVAAELGYVKDVSASNLRRGSTGTIGVIVPRLTDPAMAMFYEAVAHSCSQSDRFAVVAITDDVPGNDRAAVDRLLQRRVDGLILTTARKEDPLVEVLRSTRVPYVLALRSDGESRASVGDDELGGYLATRHLIDLGHRRIGLVAGPPYASSAQGRRSGYERALVEAGIAVDDSLVTGSSYSIEAGEQAGHALLDRSNRPTAIFAVNDNTAIGVAAVANRLGLAIPDDLSLVGYNDIAIASRLPTPLTTLRVPFDQIAQGALDLLLNESVAQQDLRVASPTLIPRKSTARPA